MEACFLLDRRGRPFTPMMNPELKRGRRPPNYGRRFPAEVYSTDEINRLLRAAGRGVSGVRNRALIVVMWRSGLRVGEVVALMPRDVDLAGGALTVRHGKGDKRRVVGIDPGAGALVERWQRVRGELDLRRGAPFFCTITTGHAGYPIQEPALRTSLKRYAERAGIDKRVHPHGFRHTHAVELLREGVPVNQIQKQLGHSDLSTTASYLDHLLPLEVVERMHARELPELAA